LSWCAHIPCIIIRLFPSSSSISSTRSFFSRPLYLLHPFFLLSSLPSPPPVTTFPFPSLSFCLLQPAVSSSLYLLYPSPLTYSSLPSSRSSLYHLLIFYTFHPPPPPRLDFLSQSRSTF
jgi:hypothetical protein